MKRTTVFLVILLVLCGLSVAPMAAAQGHSSLEGVLAQMDKAAATFRSAQADFIWEQYQKVVDEMDTQKGVMYFRRNGQNIEMAANIANPEKYVLFKDGKVSVFQSRIDQVTEYNAGKNRSEFESFLVLGFGGSGHDLGRSFDVRYAGNEMVDGVNTSKLDLTPKTDRVRGMFSKIVLWIDPARGVSVRQQFFEPSGDYRLVKYSNIQLNRKIDGDMFDLGKRTGPRTKYVRPQG